jgi:signal transduction histidine kinase
MKLFKEISGTFLSKHASLLLGVVLLLSSALLVWNEIAALRDYRNSFNQIAASQLETVAGAVNQELWYAANSWLEAVRKSTDPVYPLFLDARISKKNGLLFQRESTTLPEIPWTSLTQFDAQRLSGRPFVPTVLKGSGSGTKLLFLSIEAGDTLVYVIDPETYLQRGVEPVLEQFPAGKILYSLVFDGKTFSRHSYAQAALVRKELWTFPEAEILLYADADNHDALVSKRVPRSALLLGSAMLLVMVLVTGLKLAADRERQLSKMKSDFVANVSHELKTPLSLIRMYGESLFLGRVASPEQQKKYHGIILRETERLSKLITSVLHMSRIEAGKQVYKTEPVELNPLILQTLETFQEAFQKEGFSIETKLQTPLPIISADQDAVSEALVNLIDNAMKYSDTEKKITVSTFATASEISLSIQDAGIGMESEQLKHIFEPFYRIESHLTPKTRGSGIGLNLVQHIMQAQGGSISVHSEPGKGSTFTLHFRTI